MVLSKLCVCYVLVGVKFGCCWLLLFFLEVFFVSTFLFLDRASFSDLDFRL